MATSESLGLWSDPDAIASGSPDAIASGFIPRVLVKGTYFVVLEVLPDRGMIKIATPDCTGWLPWYGTNCISNYLEKVECK